MSAADNAAAEKKQQDQLKARKQAEQQAQKRAEEARRAAEARQAQEAANRAAEHERAAQAREQEAARARAEAAAHVQQAPTWQSALRSDLEVCNRQNFVQKVVCTEQAIWKHCPGHWGQIPECRENRRTP